MHGTLPLKHEQMFLLQLVSHPHLTSSRTATGAGGSKQYMGERALVSGLRTHPLSVVAGRIGLGLVYDLHTRLILFVL